MLFLSTSFLPKCSFFCTSKLSAVKSSNEPQTQASARTMLFLSTCLLPKCSSFCTSKLSAVKSSNEPQTQENEDSSKQMTKFLLNECGFSESQVLTIGKRSKELFKSTSIRRAQEAVQLFRDSGFTEDQVRKIILTSPTSLGLKVDTQLKPNIEFVEALGFSGGDLGRIVSRATRLLHLNLEQDLSPKIDLLMQSNMQYELVLNLFRQNPNLVLSNEEELKLEIKYVKSLGVLVGSKTFGIALSAVHGCGIENFENKLKHLATLGLSKHEILQIATKFPSALFASMDKMMKNMYFLTNTAGFKPNILVSYPALLNYSIQERLQPRHEVIKFLRKTDPTRLPKKNVVAYYISEQSFEKKFLKGSPEATKIFEKCKEPKHYLQDHSKLHLHPSRHFQPIRRDETLHRREGGIQSLVRILAIAAQGFPREDTCCSCL